MTCENPETPARPAIAGGERRAYERPTLSRFGRISGLTMGSGGNRGDGALGRTRRGGGGGGGGGGMMGMSDRRAKQNIVRVTILSNGIGLYLFDYRPGLRDLAGHGRQLGVMADEVEKVVPEAVGMHPSGYKMVNYGMLGISPADMARSCAGAVLSCNSMPSRSLYSAVA